MALIAHQAYLKFAIYAVPARCILSFAAAVILSARGDAMHHGIFSKSLFLVISLCGVCWFSSAEALVRIHIDLSAQQMEVESDHGNYTWPISSAREGYVTPNGSFAPERLERMHYSKKYHMSPMPYSIFFLGGYAIHGSYETANLGQPASHGCVRLSPQNAETLYHMVQEEGARISITGTPPGAQYASSPGTSGASGSQTDIFGFAIGADSATPKTRPAAETW
jgi:hypothetical protein